MLRKNGETLGFGRLYSLKTRLQIVSRNCTLKTTVPGSTEILGYARTVCAVVVYGKKL